MMNRKLAHGRQIEWLRASTRLIDKDLGERTDLRLVRSVRLVQGLLRDMTESRDLIDVSPWPTPTP